LTADAYRVGDNPLTISALSASNAQRNDA
jgi:hypothetical protein